MLILDEPTSGVDPLARDAFWELLIDLARNQAVTIFISTHFMNEAERCDRIALMHAGRVLATDTPRGLVRARGARNLEAAFISYFEDATKTRSTGKEGLSALIEPQGPSRARPGRAAGTPPRRLGSASDACPLPQFVKPWS